MQRWGYGDDSWAPVVCVLALDSERPKVSATLDAYPTRLPHTVLTHLAIRGVLTRTCRYLGVLTTRPLPLPLPLLSAAATHAAAGLLLEPVPSARGWAP